MDLAELLTRFEGYAGPYDHDLTRAECGCCTFLDRETEARWLGFWGAWEVATNTEREACAKVCEMEAARVDDLSDKVTGDGHPYLTGKAVASDRCARNIRMRSNVRNEGAEPLLAKLPRAAATEKQMNTQDLKILASDFMSHPLSRGISDCEKAGEALFDAAQEIDRLNIELADMCVIRGIDDRYGGRLALMLECAILNPNGYFDDACRLLDEYKAEWEKVNPSPPTFMGEPIPQDRKARLLKMQKEREQKSEEDRQFSYAEAQIQTGGF